MLTQTKETSVSKQTIYLNSILIISSVASDDAIV